MTPAVVTWRMGVVETRDGLRLDYAEHGDADGLPVVFLHGVTDSWVSFEGVLARLPTWMRAVAFSQRGHGDSSKPAVGYGIPDFAGDVREVLDALEMPAAVLVGHSMGSLVAQRTAAMHPDRVLGLVLMGSMVATRGNAGVEDLWRSAIAEMRDPVDPAFVREWQASTLARQVDPTLFHAVVRETLKVPAHVWRGAFEGFLTLDHSEILGSITAPTLIAWGSCDSFFGAGDQEALRRAIPHAEFITYPGGGHGFHWEDPATFTADVERFCRKVKP